MLKHAIKYFTLIELLVVIAIISILAAMLAPALNNAINSAKSLNCSNNLKQSMLGVQFYSNDYRNYFTFWDVDGGGRPWSCILNNSDGTGQGGSFSNTDNKNLNARYLDASVMRCPETTDMGAWRSYGMYRPCEETQNNINNELKYFELGSFITKLGANYAGAFYYRFTRMKKPSNTYILACTSAGTTRGCWMWRRRRVGTETYAIGLHHGFRTNVACGDGHVESPDEEQLRTSQMKIINYYYPNGFYVTN